MLLKSVLTMPRLMPGSPGNSRPSGAVGDTCGLGAGNERELAVERIGQRQLQVVAQAEVQRHTRVDAVIVLREDADSTRRCRVLRTGASCDIVAGRPSRKSAYALPVLLPLNANTP